MRQGAFDNTQKDESSFQGRCGFTGRRSLVPAPPPTDTPAPKLNKFENLSAGTDAHERAFATRKQLKDHGLPTIFKPNSWRIIKHLGEGGFSSVVLAQLGQEQMAVKRATSGTVQEAYLLREAQLLGKLSHESIIKLHGIATAEVTNLSSYSAKEFWLGLEYKNLGSLYDIMKKHPNWLTEPFVKASARRLVSGVVYLHQNSILHRDLKPDNLLFSHPTPDYEPADQTSKEDFLAQVSSSLVIGDMGLGRVDDGRKPLTRVGTLYYTPPAHPKESNSQQSNKLDSWGIIASVYAAAFRNDPYVFQVSLHPDIPFETLRTINGFQEIGDDSSLNLLPSPFKTNPDFRAFIKAGTRIDPEERSSPEDLQNMHWLTAKSSLLKASKL
nr:protein kinase [Sansalvadorimonas sp. 2012CJ34-2]